MNRRISARVGVGDAGGNRLRSDLGAPPYYYRVFIGNPLRL